MSVAPAAHRWLTLVRLPRERPSFPAREVDMLTGQIPMPPARLLAVLLGVALLGAASAVVALLVVLVRLWK